MVVVKQVSLQLALKAQNGLLRSDIKWEPVPLHWCSCSKTTPACSLSGMEWGN